MSLQYTSKFMSLILRHKPETIGITLDEHGWANVDELIAGISKTHVFNRELLEEIVRTDNKQRYSFNEDKTLIRANQGHSIPVDVEFEEVEPPRYLYHGTGEKYRESIDAKGLIPKSRLYVHLSADIETAIKVGTRHGKPVVYRIWSGKMHKDDYIFYKSVNGVWLTKEVPTDYIKRETFDEDEILEAALKAKSILDSGNDDKRANQILELEKQYSWEVLQQSLFRLLADNSLSMDSYHQIANVFWYAYLENEKRHEKHETEFKFKKKSIVGLLYYRLKDYEPAQKAIYNVACDLYDYDFDPGFDPLKDKHIKAKLLKYGIDIGSEPEVNQED